MRRTALAIAALLLASSAPSVLASGGPPKLANIEAGPFVAALYNDSPELATGSNTLTVKVPGLPADHTLRLDLIGPNGERLAVPLRPVVVLDDEGDGEHSHGAKQPETHAAPAVSAAADHDAHGAADEHSAMDGHTAAPADPHAGMVTSHSSMDSHAAAPAAPTAAPTAPPTTNHAGMAMGHETMAAGHSMTASQPMQAQADADHDAHAPLPASQPTAPADTHAHDAAPADVHTHDTPTELFLARGSVSLPSTGTWTAHLTVRDLDGAEVMGEAALAVTAGGPSRLYLGFTGSLIFGSMLFGMIQRRRGHARAVIAR